MTLEESDGLRALVRCGCSWDGESVHVCAAPIYVKPVADKVMTQETTLCRCQPVNPRHREAFHCVTKAELRAWYDRHPEATCSVGTAKRLAALELDYDRTVR